MIITDSFVFLNYPKTGSTFVREALSELYKKKQKKRWPWSRNKRYFEMYEAPNLRDVSPERSGKPYPHGTYWQIPQRAKHLPVYTVFREPTRRAISQYYYADWKRKEGLLAHTKLIKSQFPNFPELQLEEYLAFLRIFYPRDLTIGGVKYGPWATDFVHFFLRDRDVANKKNLQFSNIDEVRDKMGTVKFINNSNLNIELAEILMIHGFTSRDISEIQAKEKSNVSAASMSQNLAEQRAIVTDAMQDDARLIHNLANI